MVITLILIMTASLVQQDVLLVRVYACVKSACQAIPYLLIPPRVSVSFAHRHVQPVLNRQISV